MKDEEKYQQAIEILRTTPAGADSPPVPDPSTAVETGGWCFDAKLFQLIQLEETRALDKREYLMIIFLISYLNVSKRIEGKVTIVRQNKVASVTLCFIPSGKKVTYTPCGT